MHREVNNALQNLVQMNLNPFIVCKSFGNISLVKWNRGLSGISFSPFIPKQCVKRFNHVQNEQACFLSGHLLSCF